MPSLWIEARRGFVQHDDSVIHERPARCLVAASCPGERTDCRVVPTRVRERKQLVDTRPHSVASEAEVARVHFQVFGDAEIRVEVVGLRHDTGTGANQSGVVVNGFAEYLKRARRSGVSGRGSFAA